MSVNLAAMRSFSGSEWFTAGRYVNFDRFTHILFEKQNCSVILKINSMCVTPILYITFFLKLILAEISKGIS